MLEDRCSSHREPQKTRVGVHAWREKRGGQRGSTDKEREGVRGFVDRGRWAQESCKYGRETDFCGRSASGKEILDVRDVCFASRATTVQPRKGKVRSNSASCTLRCMCDKSVRLSIKNKNHVLSCAGRRANRQRNMLALLRDTTELRRPRICISRFAGSRQNFTTTRHGIYVHYLASAAGI